MWSCAHQYENIFFWRIVTAKNAGPNSPCNVMYIFELNGLLLLIYFLHIFTS